MLGCVRVRVLAVSALCYGLVLDLGYLGLGFTRFRVREMVCFA